VAGWGDDPVMAELQSAIADGFGPLVTAFHTNFTQGIGSLSPAPSTSTTVAATSTTTSTIASTTTTTTMPSCTLGQPCGPSGTCTCVQGCGHAGAGPTCVQFSGEFADPCTLDSDCASFEPQCVDRDDGNICVPANKQCATPCQ